MVNIGFKVVIGFWKIIVILFFWIFSNCFLLSVLICLLLNIIFLLFSLDIFFGNNLIIDLFNMDLL